MNHPKLLPSQELVLHQVSVDSFSPATASVLKFPTSPLLPRSPFSSSASSAAASPLLSSPLNPAAAIAASSIVRPQIRLREEWAASLADVEAFELGPQSLHSSTFSRREAVPVRYIADRYDRGWLSRRPVLALRGEDGGVSLLRGKTGGVGTHIPIESNLSASALEDVFTELELAAYRQPEVPLERLLPYAKSQLTETALRDESLEELHAYWLLRRSGNGGLLYTIPTLRATIREDNEMALCHSAVLRDCPLPFKQRDWYVPVVERRLPASKRPRSPSPCDGTDESCLAALLDTCADHVENALRLSRAMLQREEARLAHVHLSLYELAHLRHVADEEAASAAGEHAPVPVHAVSHFLTANTRASQ